MVSRTRTSLIAVGVLLLSLLPAGAVSAGQANPVTSQLAHANAAHPAYRDSAQPVARPASRYLLGRMTLDEKIGQMTQAERGAVADDRRRSHLRASARCCPAAARRRRPTRPPAWAGHGRRLPERRRSPPGCSIPMHLRHRRRARPRQRARRDACSRTTSASAPRATRRWSQQVGAITAEETRPPASAWASRRASAWRATSAGAAPTRASARTRRWSIADGDGHRRPAGHGGS